MTNPYGHDGRPDFVDGANNAPLTPSNLDPAPSQSDAPRVENSDWATRQVNPQGTNQWPPQQPTPAPRRETTQQAEHPRAMTVLILGILGFLLWIPGIVGWVMGGNAKKQINKGAAPYPWDGALRAGYTLSVLSTILGAVYVLSLLGLGVLIAALMQ